MNYPVNYDRIPEPRTELSPVDEALSTLSNCIDALEGNCGRLKDRLKPVLAPEVEKAPSTLAVKEAPPQPQSVLVGRIRELTNRVKHTDALIGGVHQTLS